MKTAKRLFILLLAVAMLAIALTGCSTANAQGTTGEKTRSIDWKLYGAWVTADGQVQEAVEFSMSVSDIPTEYAPMQATVLDTSITMPEDFFAAFAGESYVGYADVSRDEDYPECFWLAGYSYDPSTNGPIFSRWVICLDQEFAVFNWEDVDGYLVASTDPDADLASLVFYYENFGNSNVSAP